MKLSLVTLLALVVCIALLVDMSEAQRNKKGRRGKKGCRGRPRIANGVAKPNRRGRAAFVTCNPGFTLSGRKRIRCNRRTRKWLVRSTSCLTTTTPNPGSNGCGSPPPNVLNAAAPVLSDGGLTALYQCDVGFQVAGAGGNTQASIQCNTIANFWPSAPSCERICPPPGNIANAAVPTVFNAGTSATYNCNTNYRVGATTLESTTIQCNTATRTWPAVTCTEYDCLPTPTVTNGNPPSGSFSYPIASYTCAAGFSLKAGTPSMIQCTKGSWPLAPNLPVCEAV